jgi:hypothetical protein
MIRRIRYYLGSVFYKQYLFLGYWYSKYLIFRNSKNEDGKWLTIDECMDKKTSDTLFIMGSGPSINSMSQEQWAEIGKADVLGMNYWMLHELVPDYYMFEMPHPNDEETYNGFINNLKIKREQYKDVLFILKQGKAGMRNSSVLKKALNREIYTLFNPVMPVFTEDKVGQAIRFVNRKKSTHSSSSKNIMEIFSKRASLYTAILFAYNLGYKKIVLCGVDLVNSDYFFYHRRRELECQDYFVPDYKSYDNAHFTNNKSYGEVTISILLKEVCSNILEPSNVELYVSHNKSALSEFLPVHWS